MKNQKIRSMKVHEQSGYNYKATPTIILKGQWLKEMGFEIGDYITVSCEEGKLIITPDAEKAAMAKAEAFLRGNTYVLPSDIKNIIVETFAHRMVMDVIGAAGNDAAGKAIQDILKCIPVPKIQ